MNRKVLVCILVLATLTIASIGGVLLYRSANAAAPSLLLSSSREMGPGRGGPGRGIDGGASNEELANALGITVDELTAAYQKANQAALAKAVSDGLITQAQADQLKSDGQAFPFGGRWMGWFQQQGVDYDTFLAEALGISTEKLQAAYTQAFDARLDQAVMDGKLTRDQAELMKAQRALSDSQSFKSAMQTAYEAAIKQAVGDGVITQAQADAILKAQSEKGSGMGMPFMDFFGKGHGMDGHGWGENPAAPNAGGNPPASNNGGQTAPYPPDATPGSGSF